MNDAFVFILTFLAAFCLSLVLTPLMIVAGKRFHVVAKLDARRRSEGDKRGLSKLGGVALYFSFVITVLLTQFLNVPRFDPNETVRLTGLLIGATIIFVVGVIDDVRELPPWVLLLAQVISAGVAISFKIFIEGFNNPLTGQQTEAWPFLFTVILTFFWLTGMTNTVNWLDGLDGLAAGVIFISAVVLFINSAFILDPHQTSVSLLPLALMGATLGFLPFNFHPARIFAGGGAFLLGYLIACLSIIGGAKMATILMVMGLPLMDAAWQIMTRTLQGKSPFRGDRGHLHFRLFDLGLSQRQICLGYYGFCTVFGTLTLIIPSKQFKFVSLLLMGAIILAGFMLLLLVPVRKSEEQQP